MRYYLMVKKGTDYNIYLNRQLKAIWDEKKAIQYVLLELGKSSVEQLIKNTRLEWVQF